MTVLCCLLLALVGAEPSAEPPSSPTVVAVTLGVNIGGGLIARVVPPTRVVGGFLLGFRPELVVSPAGLRQGFGAYGELLTSRTFDDVLVGGGALVRLFRGLTPVLSCGVFARHAVSAWNAGVVASLLVGAYSHEDWYTGAFGLRLDTRFIPATSELAVSLGLQIDLLLPMILAGLGGR